jgi:small nuclear ribonucleoprotein D3
LGFPKKFTRKKKILFFLVKFFEFLQKLKMSVGVPVKLMHEAKLHVVTVELKTGELYRGYLVEAEDNMNCRLDSCQMTARDGKNAYLEQVYLRGAQIRFVIVPDMLKEAPMFKRVRNLAKGKNTAQLRQKALKARDQVFSQGKTN